MGEIKFTNGLIMSALFAIVIITFAINFAVDNDSAITLASDDSDFEGTASNATDDLITFSSTIGDAQESFDKDNVQEGTDTATSGGQFKEPGKASYSTAIGAMTSSFNKIFGREFSVVLLTLTTVILFVGVRYWYKTWFGKDPD